MNDSSPLDGAQPVKTLHYGRITVDVRRSVGSFNRTQYNYELYRLSRNGEKRFDFASFDNEHISWCIHEATRWILTQPKTL